MDLIEQLKNNQVPFGLMDAEMQAKAKEIGHEVFEKWIGGIWHLDKGDFFGTDLTYRLPPDYAPAPEYVECEIVEEKEFDGMCLKFVTPEATPALHLAINWPEFAGFKYEGFMCGGEFNAIISQPWMYSNGAYNLQGVSSKTHKLPVHASHVILRSK